MSLERLTSTGERIDPDMGHDFRLINEHQQRYRFAGKVINQEMSENSGNKLIIDCACGTGYGIKDLNNGEDVSVIGVDIDLEVCKYAATRNGGNPVIQADARRLPFKDNICEAVVSFETLEHVHDPKKIVSEFSRVISQGGLLIASTPEKSIMQAESYRNPKRTFNRYHLREMTSVELDGMLSSCGFKTIRLFGQRVFSRIDKKIYFSFILPVVKKASLIPEKLARKAAYAFIMLTTGVEVKNLTKKDKAEFILITGRKPSVSND